MIPFALAAEAAAVLGTRLAAASAARAAAGAATRGAAAAASRGTAGGFVRSSAVPSGAGAAGESATGRAMQFADDFLFNKDIGVSSSFISSVRYNSITDTLEVRFSDGHIYDYHGVPASLFFEMISSPSAGHVFNSQIRDSY